MSSSLIRVPVVPYTEQAHALFSFTGKMFYRVTPHPDMKDSSGGGWRHMVFTPAERYGAYSLEPKTQQQYCEEYGLTDADPICGPGLYLTYNMLVDTGIIVVRGLVHFLAGSRRDPVKPLESVDAWIQDARDPAPDAA